MLENTCCFIGHRTINETEELKTQLRAMIETLITEQTVDTFLFGSGSCFDDLCLELVTELKERYPHIKRIYVRAAFPYISEDYTACLLESYDDTYFPETVLGAGRASYVKRNREMIDNSRFCVFYYEESCAPTTRKSGTKLALEYALKRKKEIILLPANEKIIVFR